MKDNVKKTVQIQIRLAQERLDLSDIGSHDIKKALEHIKEAEKHLKKLSEE